MALAALASSASASSCSPTGSPRPPALGPQPRRRPSGPRYLASPASSSAAAVCPLLVVARPSNRQLQASILQPKASLSALNRSDSGGTTASEGKSEESCLGFPGSGRGGKNGAVEEQDWEEEIETVDSEDEEVIRNRIKAIEGLMGAGWVDTLTSLSASASSSGSPSRERNGNAKGKERATAAVQDLPLFPSAAAAPYPPDFGAPAPVDLPKPTSVPISAAGWRSLSGGERPKGPRVMAPRLPLPSAVPLAPPEKHGSPPPSGRTMAKGLVLEKLGSGQVYGSSGNRSRPKAGIAPPSPASAAPTGGSCVFPLIGSPSAPDNLDPARSTNPSRSHGHGRASGSPRPSPRPSMLERPPGSDTSASFVTAPLPPPSPFPSDTHPVVPALRPLSQSLDPFTAQGATRPVEPTRRAPTPPGATAAPAPAPALAFPAGLLQAKPPPSKSGSILTVHSDASTWVLPPRPQLDAWDQVPTPASSVLLVRPGSPFGSEGLGLVGGSEANARVGSSGSSRSRSDIGAAATAARAEGRGEGAELAVGDGLEQPPLPTPLSAAMARIGEALLAHAVAGPNAAPEPKGEDWTRPSCVLGESSGEAAGPAVQRDRGPSSRKSKVEGAGAAAITFNVREGEGPRPNSRVVQPITSHLLPLPGEPSPPPILERNSDIMNRHVRRRSRRTDGEPERYKRVPVAAAAGAATTAARRSQVPLSPGCSVAAKGAGRPLQPPTRKSSLSRLQGAPAASLAACSRPPPKPSRPSRRPPSSFTRHAQSLSIDSIGPRRNDPPAALQFSEPSEPLRMSADELRSLKGYEGAATAWGWDEAEPRAGRDARLPRSSLHRRSASMSTIDSAAGAASPSPARRRRTSSFKALLCNGKPARDSADEVRSLRRYEGAMAWVWQQEENAPPLPQPPPQADRSYLDNDPYGGPPAGPEGGCRQSPSSPHGSPSRGKATLVHTRSAAADYAAQSGPRKSRKRSSGASAASPERGRGDVRRVSWPAQWDAGSVFETRSQYEAAQAAVYLARPSEEGYRPAGLSAEEAAGFGVAAPDPSVAHGSSVSSWVDAGQVWRNRGSDEFATGPDDRSAPAARRAPLPPLILPCEDQRAAARPDRKTRARSILNMLRGSTASAPTTPASAATAGTVKSTSSAYRRKLARRKLQGQSAGAQPGEAAGRYDDVPIGASPVSVPYETRPDLGPDPYEQTPGCHLLPRASPTYSRTLRIRLTTPASAPPSSPPPPPQLPSHAPATAPAASRAASLIPFRMRGAAATASSPSSAGTSPSPTLPTVEQADFNLENLDRHLSFGSPSQRFAAAMGPAYAMLPPRAVSASSSGHDCEFMGSEGGHTYESHVMSEEVGMVKVSGRKEDNPVEDSALQVDMLNAMLSIEQDDAFLDVLETARRHDSVRRRQGRSVKLLRSQASPEWKQEVRTLFIVRELIASERSYALHLRRLLDHIPTKSGTRSRRSSIHRTSTFLFRDSAFLESLVVIPDGAALLHQHLPAIIAASDHLLSRLVEDPSPWGAAIAFLAVEDQLRSVLSEWAPVIEDVLSWVRSKGDPALPRPDKGKPPPPGSDAGHGGSIGKGGKKGKGRGSNRLGYSDVVIMPVQRLTRYPLFLQELLKHTTDSTAPAIMVEQALAATRSVAEACDHFQNGHGDGDCAGSSIAH